MSQVIMTKKVIMIACCNVNTLVIDAPCRCLFTNHINDKIDELPLEAQRPPIIHAHKCMKFMQRILGRIRTAIRMD